MTELERIYDTTLDILESYTDDLARTGPDGLLGLVASLQNALKEVNSSITALHMRPYLEKSNEMVREMSSRGEIRAESCPLDDETTEDKCKET